MDMYLVKWPVSGLHVYLNQTGSPFIKPYDTIVSSALRTYIQALHSSPNDGVLV